MADDIPISEISGCTCLRLRKLARRATKIYDHALAPARLTITQFSILAQLEGRGPLIIGTLAEQMAMDPTTLTRTLRPMQARGLVHRGRDESDGRRGVIALTEAGRAALADAAPLWRAAQARLAARLGPDAAAELNGRLDTGISRLSDIPETDA